MSSVVSVCKKIYASERGKVDSTKELLKRLEIPTSEKTPRYHNPGKIAARVALISAVSALVLFPAGVYLLAHLDFKNHANLFQTQFTKAELTQIKKDTIRALNQIQYQDHGFALSRVSEEFRQDVNQFSASFANAFEKQGSYLYSPLGLYLNLDMLSLSSLNAVEEQYTQFLGLQARREQDLPKAISTDFFTDKSGSTHIYQGAFFQDGLEVKEDYLNKLTARQVEAFQLDFESDLSFISTWANEKAGEPLMNQKDLGYNEDPFKKMLAYFFSILEFKGKWGVPFYETDSFNYPFLNIDGQESLRNFMTHKLWLRASDDYGAARQSGVYEYEGYVSAYDLYNYGYTIQYLTPKERDGNIFELLKGKNFFVETPENSVNYVAPNSEYRYTDHVEVLKINVPSFDFSDKLDLTKTIKAMGLNKPYNDVVDVLDGGFDNFTEIAPEGGGIAFTKQINSISLDENGTIAKSITFSGGYGSASASPGKIYEITLDSPFVYVIRDPNGLPLFVGAVAR